MQGLQAAFALLTCLPVRAVASGQSEAAGWFPLVGLAVGGVTAAALWFGGLVDPWLGAWLAVFVWLSVTGFLHADGLADLADGLVAAHGDKTRLLAVMKDPHVGSFGALALILLVAGKLVALMLLSTQGAWLAVFLIPAWTRWGAWLWMRSLSPLTQGMAALYQSAHGLRMGIFWLAALATASMFLASVLVFAPLVIGCWLLFLRQKLGGMNGDAIGAGIEVCEVVLLLLVMINGV